MLLGSLSHQPDAQFGQLALQGATPVSEIPQNGNRHDAKLLVATLEGLVVARHAWEEGDEQQHMCLDVAYDSEPVRAEPKERGYTPPIRPADKK